LKIPKLTSKIHPGGSGIIPDHQIWESCMEVSHVEAFRHFMVQSVLKCCKKRGHRSREVEVILAIGCEEDTWQQIGEFGR
jgi:hypothetical protein